MLRNHDAFSPSNAPRPRRVAPGLAPRVVRSVLALAGRSAQLIDHRERPWASVTFSGARHTVILRYTGWEACDDGEALIAALPDHEFTVPGAVVADVTVVRTDEAVLPQRTLEVELELLLLDQG
ncbi:MULTISPECIES: hypothetical protein [unclassified Novosphingobium]|uniref:hypothetical protein n=1 Tax=unclassified Novosphingobium TaxID=2644732 RepID=UPI000D4BF9F4|nr:MULTISPECIES: hypothetical protein [unclassified Novosphingobium]PTR12807.1 hypothetical protein C8K11_102266 [Novosphingobium sp. GV055]PUB06591.1 hypothetical protein C8K12_102266 [Novosphingobium sp. GV061]PUB22642.1 hypothetical protein C8K14_102266 [Novosphingobium sp. GV079]PUB44667.1 hypothetical protein C8K10_102266 [Novosphingobium sp. GV027]